MTSTNLTDNAAKFRSAVEAHDFPLAQTALQEYVICFQSCIRTLAEVEDARNLLQWSVQATRTKKAQLSDELMLLKRIVAAYRQPKRVHTWHVEG